MVILIECIVLCLVFTFMVCIMAKNPIATLYNYPPKIQERVKSLAEYKDKIPTNKNKVVAKTFAALIIVIIVSLILRYVNGYTAFNETFFSAVTIWTVVNAYDVVVMDIIWFCHDKRFRFKGTEEMGAEYTNYMFHIKEGLKGEIIGITVSIIIGMVVHFIL